jgi:metallo-beta-lactamase family protein
MMEWAEEGRGRKLLFTADVGRYGTPILRDPEGLGGPFDHVITESTYGNGKHAPIEQVGGQLLEAVKSVIAGGGRLLVPSFAVGRTQTILWYMQRFISEGAMPAIPIFVDSPMGVEVSRVHSEFRDNYDEETNSLIGKKDLFGLSRVTFASSMKESKRINEQHGPCVIIASSPTCEFGRILHHLKVSLENPRDMIIFVGWTPYQTLGRRLQEGEKRVRVLDSWYDVRCQIKTIHGLSAHADADELLKFLGPTLSAQTTAYVVHGEEPQAEAFASRLLASGVGKAVVPAMESSALEYSVAAVPPAQPTRPAGDD